MCSWWKVGKARRPRLPKQSFTKTGLCLCLCEVVARLLRMTCLSGPYNQCTDRVPPCWIFTSKKTPAGIQVGYAVLAPVRAVQRKQEQELEKATETHTTKDRPGYRRSSGEQAARSPRGASVFNAR